MARIWTVEDEEHISVLIVDVLKGMEHEVQHFWDGAELTKGLAKHPVPDLLLLDLMLRGKSGFDLLKQWKQKAETRHIPVLILSARSTENDKVKGLDLGAEDYITKPFSIRELKARINAALRRVTPEALRVELGALRLEPDNRGVYVDGASVALTQQEFELLLYLAKNAGHILSRGQLLKDVWGYESETDASRTVDYHVKSLRRKLGDDAQNSRLIETVHGSGYRLKDAGV